MSAAQTSEWPAGTGQNAKQNTAGGIIPFAQKIGNPNELTAMTKARFARAGHLVHTGGNDDFIVVQANWGMSKYCADYAALVAFGRQLGVRP